MAVDCLTKPSGSCQVMRRRAALPPVAVAVAHTSWPKLNSTFAAPQVPPVPSNVAIDGVGVAWGIINGKLVVGKRGLNSCCGANTGFCFESALLESVAGTALLLPSFDVRPQEDSDDDENKGMPISAIRATSIPIRIIELKLTR